MGKPEATTEDTTGRLLSLPVPEKCANRPKHFEHGGHHYFFSGDEENFTDHKVDWLDGEHLQGVLHGPGVSGDAQRERDDREVHPRQRSSIFWSSGRLCNFKGCDRE